MRRVSHQLSHLWDFKDAERLPPTGFLSFEPRALSHTANDRGVYSAAGTGWDGGIPRVVQEAYRPGYTPLPYPGWHITRYTLLL